MPGQKKQQRNEQALRLGFDLADINARLDALVLKHSGIYAVEPMNQNYDRAQVPGQHVGRAARSIPISKFVTGEEHPMAKNVSHVTLQPCQSLQATSHKRGGRKHKSSPTHGSLPQLKSRRMPSGREPKSADKGRVTSSQGKVKYASNLMSFVSSGIVGAEEENSSSAVLGGTAGLGLESNLASSVTERGESSRSGAASSHQMQVMPVGPAAFGTFEAVLDRA